MMLVLSRRQGESIVIGDDIVIKIIRLSNGSVSVGIDAPVAIPVHRQEIYDLIHASCAEARGESVVE